MKKYPAILFFLFAFMNTKAQTPSSVFRDWQNDPLIARQHEIQGQFAAWQIYFDYSTGSELKYVKRIKPVVSDEYFHPTVSEMWRTEIPHSAYFCRMEQYTSLNYGIMFSLHAGGFNEQDELCH